MPSTWFERPANFYPRPPRGGRPNAANLPLLSGRFLSTPSARRATTQDKIATLTAEFLSTPSARRATSGRRGPSQGAKFLSTPSARRATLGIAFQKSVLINFYPRPPRGGRRRDRDPEVVDTIFLSTPSARRATHHHGGRTPEKKISIHALREEGDLRFSPSLSMPG